MEKKISLDNASTFELLGLIAVVLIFIVPLSIGMLSQPDQDCQYVAEQAKKEAALKQCVEKNKTTVPDLINYCKFTVGEGE